jgi:cytochrome oxidase assembly protein ShyY1
VSDIRNEHYAITWYRLAAVLIVMLLFWIRTRRRDVG